MAEPSDPKTQKTIAAFAIMLAVALLAVGEIVYTHRKATPETSLAPSTSSRPTNSQAQPNTSSSPAVTAGSANQSNFKDGTYKATGSYSSPAGDESIIISVTLKNGVISDSSAQAGANDLTAKQYQSDFIQNYKTQVVGKNITQVQLSRVSGSSLTPQGFSSALAKIKSQAQA